MRKRFEGFQGGRWKDSSLGDGHGEDHPDEKAADDVLEGFTKNNDNKGQWVNHRSWKVEGGRWKVGIRFCVKKAGGSRRSGGGVPGGGGT